MTNSDATRHTRISILTLSIAGLLSVLCMPCATSTALAATPQVEQTEITDDQSSETDSEDIDWESLTREQRREMWRKRTVSQYIPDGGAPKIADLDRYIDKFADRIVYDRRYYLFDVTATHVPNTTGTINLSGEVYPAEYRRGISETLETLGFNIAGNDITALPQLADGQHPYGVSTTSVATLRREPFRRGEQLDSVALGGWVRVLRTANADDISRRSHVPSHHAPGANKLKDDSPDDWILAQTMEGYLGFARKADFDMRDDYRLPDGILKRPLSDFDNGTTLSAGVFVYGDPDAGWHLFSGKKLPTKADVADLRPTFSAERIKSLMKPFMDTGYVWGGTTDQGIDCSGFAQFFMRTNGVMIPRDAVQQATNGLIVAWGGKDVMEKAKPGDLIFFATYNGRVHHVAISLGGKNIIHSAGKGVHLSSLEDAPRGDPDGTYADEVMFARRVATR